MRARRHTAVAIGAAAVSLAACGGDTGSAGGEWTGSMRDSAGITVVTNPDAGVWTDADRWRITEHLRIGTAGGDPNYQFGQISGIAELSDGRLAVLDAQAQHLRIFSADGMHLRTIGRAGSGPGEFGLGAGPVLIGPGDSIYVPDVSNQRLNKFTPEAEPVGSSPFDFSTGIPLAWMDTPDGLLISQIRPFAFPGQAIEPDSFDVILSRGTDGAVIDTLMSFPSGQTFQMRDGVPDFTFFSAEPIWSMLSTGELVYGYNDEYRLLVYEGDELHRIVEKPFERSPVSEEDEGLMIEAMSRIWEEFGVPPEAMNVLRDAIGFAEFYPAYALVRGGPEGSIWVQHLRLPSEMSERERESFNPQVGFSSPDWDVFDPEGRFLGELRMPDRFQPLRIDSDKIYGIWLDELDVQYVLILSVDWVAEELESGAS